MCLIFAPSRAESACLSANAAARAAALRYTLRMETSEENIEPITVQPDQAQDDTSAIAEDPSNLVLIVHASVGSGHRSAANAIAQAFETLRTENDPIVPADVQVEVLDILDFGRHKFDGDATASMFIGPTRPLYDVTWRYFLTGRVLWGGGTIWSRLMFSPFTNYIAEKRPLAVIATHITAANSSVSARMITGQNFPIICVPTDYETEGMWPHAAADLFCVATESMAETLRARLVKDERILITGIPTREAFRRTYSTNVVRNQFGLPHDKTVVLALAGAHLQKPYEHFRESLGKMLPYLHTFKNMHFVIVCGNDKDYENRMKRACDDLSIKNATVLGYVEDMASLMAASNLIVCKSGGLTVTECLCAQVPMILLGRAYGQEKINVEMLTEQGAAMHVTTWRELLVRLRQIKKHPERINAMLINGQSVRKPNAARDIAHATMIVATEHPLGGDGDRGKHFLNFYIGDAPAHVR